MSDLTSTAAISTQLDPRTLKRRRTLLAAAVGGFALSLVSWLHAAPASAATCNGAVASLAVSTPNGTPITAGVPFGISITARDISNATCDDFVGTARLTNGNGSASISGQSEVTTAPFVNGVLSNFPIYMTQADGNLGYGFHTIVATVVTDTNIATGNSQTGPNGFIIIQPAAADHLAFTVQPTTAVPGATISPSVKVAVKDQYNNTLNHSGPYDITVALYKGAAPASTLGGTATKTTSMTVQAYREVTFDNLTVSPSNTSLFLRATSSPTVTSADSSTFDVASTKLTLTGSITTSVNTTSTSFLTVTLPDNLTAPQSIKLHSTTSGVSTFSGEGTGKPVATKIGATNDYCIAIPTGTTVMFAYRDTVAGSPSITAAAAYAGGTAEAPDCSTTANTSAASSALQVEIQFQGKSVTINGAGFGAKQNSSAVLWGDTPITQLCTAITTGAKVNCISKWSDKSVAFVPPPGESGDSVSLGVRVGDADTGVFSAVSSEADDTFFYGPWITDVTPLGGSATIATKVTIAGLGLASATTVNWGDDHPLSKCGSTKADCFTPSATKITVYAPLKADAGDDASDGEVVVSIDGGGTRSNVDTTFRYGLPLITAMTWSVSDPLNPKSLTITGAAFGAKQDSSAVLWGDTPITQLCTAITSGAKVNCIGKWSDKSVTIVPPGAEVAGSATVAVRVGDDSTGVVSTTTSEADDTFFYGPWITDVSPLAGGTTAPTVTISGLGLLAAQKVNWGADHPLFKCSTTTTDCFKASATKLTVYGPLKADAGEDAADGEVVISVNGGGTRSTVDATFRYGVPLITGLTWT